MIYNKWGTPVELLAYCGKHALKGYPHPLRLVRVRYTDDGGEGYQFTAFLKADDGINEIDQTVDALPERKLSRIEKASAIKQAN